MKKRKVFMGATVVAAMMGLSACSTPLQDAQTKISQAGLNELNSSEVVKVKVGGEVEKYKFLGANFNSNADNFDIEVCGVTSCNGGQDRAYATMYYTVPVEEFKGVNGRDSVAVINTLASVIDNYEMTDFSYAIVKDFNGVNSAVRSVLESPLNDYKTNACLVYGIDNLQFNYEEGYAAFTTYEDTKYSRTRTEMVWTIVGFDMEGNAEYGYTLQTVTDYEGFVQEHNMYVRATAEELDAMQQDNSLVFDKFVDAVKSGDKTNYTVQSVNVEKDTLFNTNLLGSADYSL